MQKVVKFGGSSLASAKQFKKVKKIISEDPARKYVVPSAPGKRHNRDIKVTDMLYSCYKKAEDGEYFLDTLEAIQERYEKIIEGLELSLSLEEEFKEIQKQFEAKSGSAYAASRGEYLNGIIMSAYLEMPFIDAAEVIFFDENGNFDDARTDMQLKKRLSQESTAVIPGFYGAKPDGTIQTFSRGGSDITGSLVAKAIDADLYENWTDVSGFMVTDPRIIKNPEMIETITYQRTSGVVLYGSKLCFMRKQSFRSEKLEFRLISVIQTIRKNRELIL